MNYKHIKNDVFERRVKLSEREDGYVISTVKSFDNWYGLYETGFWHKDIGDIKILKGYANISAATNEHIKFCEMSTEELENYKTIG